MLASLRKRQCFIKLDVVPTDAWIESQPIEVDGRFTKGDDMPRLSLDVFRAMVAPSYRWGLPSPYVWPSIRCSGIATPSSCSLSPLFWPPVTAATDHPSWH